MTALATTLILGGARSGKSAFAEALVRADGRARAYIATGTAGDHEMSERIADHRERRGPNWRTIEEPLRLTDVITREASQRTVLLVDCLTLWLSNLMFAERDIEAKTATLVHVLKEVAGPVVLVSNEVGLGLVPDTPLGRRFRDAQGRINQAVAAEASRVVFVAAGLALELKPPRAWTA